jgi:hypothetical protein
MTNTRPYLRLLARILPFLFIGLSNQQDCSAYNPCPIGCCSTYRRSSELVSILTKLKVAVAGVVLVPISAELLPVLRTAISSQIVIQAGVWSGHETKSARSMSAALSEYSRNVRCCIAIC